MIYKAHDLGINLFQFMAAPEHFMATAGTKRSSNDRSLNLHDASS